MRKVWITLAGLLLALLAARLGPRMLNAEPGPLPGGAAAQADQPAPATRPADARTPEARVGFTSQRALQEHFEKHGREFGPVSQAQYLRLAQALRDAPRGGDVLEAVRADGVVTRFDRGTGAFVAFHRDLTIRTFFKPNDGERYFERQLGTEHR
jgi:pyocin large subunit-like protein